MVHRPFIHILWASTKIPASGGGAALCRCFPLPGAAHEHPYLGLRSHDGIRTTICFSVPRTRIADFTWPGAMARRGTRGFGFRAEQARNAAERSGTGAGRCCSGVPRATGPRNRRGTARNFPRNAVRNRGGRRRGTSRGLAGK